MDYSNRFYLSLRSVARRASGHRPTSTVASPVDEPTHPEKHRRRQSMGSLSFRLLDPTTSSRSTRNTPSRCFPARKERISSPKRPSQRRDSAAEISDMWITKAGALNLDSSSIPCSSIHESETDDDDLHPGPIEPLFVSPSTPFFITFPDPWSSGQSFLSLSTSPRDSPTYPLPRRARPTSVQTLPLPSRRPPEQVEHPTRRAANRDEDEWMSEEFVPGVSSNQDVSEEDEEREIDWRQFHADWLQNTCLIPPTPDV